MIGNLCIANFIVLSLEGGNGSHQGSLKMSPGVQNLGETKTNLIQYNFKIYDDDDNVFDAPPPEVRPSPYTVSSIC